MDTRAREQEEGEVGQASVELVAALPAILACGLICWQLALAGHALWAGANAARIGARAAAVGADPERAVRSALPARLERGLQVDAPGGSKVRVRLRVPTAIGGQGPRVTASAALEARR
jgi:hypothetical protein